MNNGGNIKKESLIKSILSKKADSEVTIGILKSKGSKLRRSIYTSGLVGSFCTEFAALGIGVQAVQQLVNNGAESIAGMMERNPVAAAALPVAGVAAVCATSSIVNFFRDLKNTDRIEELRDFNDVADVTVSKVETGEISPNATLEDSLEYTNHYGTCDCMGVKHVDFDSQHVDMSKVDGLMSKYIKPVEESIAASDQQNNAQ